MGISTDALLLYGVPLDEDTELTYDEDAGDPANGPAYMAYMGEAEDGISIIVHCSEECPMYFVIIEDTLTRAWRGYPKAVSTSPSKPDWAKRLKAFCKTHKLLHGKPDWYLASVMG